MKGRAVVVAPDARLARERSRGRVSRVLRRIAEIAMSATASTVFFTTASFAAPPYDGIWSVSIVTIKGDCIASYRYPMRISNGVLANAGDLIISVNGKVTRSGAITVRVSQGNTTALGSGRLSTSFGRGSWSAASCSGSWLAERRSS